MSAADHDFDVVGAYLIGGGLDDIILNFPYGIQHFVKSRRV